MIPHRSPGELASFDELEPRARRRVRRHLVACQRCRDELHLIRTLRNVAEEVTSPALPADGFAAIRARRDAGERVILPADTAGLRPPGRRIWPMALAGTVLVAAVIAAQIVIRQRGPVEVEEAAPSVADVQPPPVGVSVVPASGRAEVRITASGPFRLEASIQDGAELAVRGRGAADRARFRITGSGVSVTELTGGVIEVRIPRGMAGQIYLGDVPVIVADGRLLRAEATGATGRRLVLDLGR